MTSDIHFTTDAFFCGFFGIHFIIEYCCVTMPYNANVRAFFPSSVIVYRIFFFFFSFLFVFILWSILDYKRIVWNVKFLNIKTNMCINMLLLRLLCCWILFWNLCQNICDSILYLKYYIYFYPDFVVFNYGK